MTSNRDNLRSSGKRYVNCITSDLKVWQTFIKIEKKTQAMKNKML